MTTIKKYTKKDGSTAYMFNAYLGVDELTGKKKRTTRRGFRTQKEAKRAIAKIELELDDFQQKEDNYTFSQVFDLWFNGHKKRIKDSTIYRIEQLETHLKNAFGEYKINKIKSSYIQKVFDDWSSKFKSFFKLISYTKIVFKYAYKHRLINENPIERVDTPKHSKQVYDKNVFMDKETLNKFLENLKMKGNVKLYTAFRLLAYTGMRKGELYALNWNDIDFDKCSISISKTVSNSNHGRYISTPKTYQSNRTISVDEQTLIELKKWRLEQRKYFLERGIRIKQDAEQLIFSSLTNQIIENAYLNSFLKRIDGIDVTVHSFRHTHASLLFESGATIKQVQERLGHANVQTTLDIYTHVSKNLEKETADNFLKFMQG